VRENIGAKGMDGDGLIRGRLRRCCGEGGIESDRYVDSLGGGGSWGRFYFREICGCRDGNIPNVPLDLKLRRSINSIPQLGQYLADETAYHDSKKSIFSQLQVFT